MLILSVIGTVTVLAIVFYTIEGYSVRRQRR